MLENTVAFDVAFIIYYIIKYFVSLYNVLDIRVEAGYNASIGALRRKGILVPGDVTGPPCHGGHKYGYLVPQVGRGTQA
jgi:hypothetical protein